MLVGASHAPRRHRLSRRHYIDRIPGASKQVGGSTRVRMLSPGGAMSLVARRRSERSMDQVVGERGRALATAKRNGAGYGTPVRCPPRSFVDLGASGSARLLTLRATGPAGPEARRKRQRSRACTTHSPKVREVPIVTQEKAFVLMLLKKL